MRFIRSTLAQNETPTVSTTTTYDLPSNPLSHINFTLKCLNDTGTLTNYSVMKALLAQVSLIQVLYKGQAIISGSMSDLMMLTYTMLRGQPFGCNFIKTDNFTRSISVLIPFGRFLYQQNECFPATNHGELQLQITYAAGQTGIDNLLTLIETVELVDAQPQQFIKSTTLNRTPSATGWFDVDMPLGNKLVGVLLWANTVPVGASYNTSLGQIKLLVDNLEYDHAFTNWESLHGELLALRPALWLAEHFHRALPAGSNVEFDTGIQQVSDSFLEHYSYLDYDPLQDGSYLIDTAGHRRVNLRLNQEPSADASRFMPVELVQVGSAF